MHLFQIINPLFRHLLKGFLHLFSGFLTRNVSFCFSVVNYLIKCWSMIDRASNGFSILAYIIGHRRTAKTILNDFLDQHLVQHCHWFAKQTNHYLRLFNAKCNKQKKSKISVKKKTITKRTFILIPNKDNDFYWKDIHRPITKQSGTMKLFVVSHIKKIATNACSETEIV